MRGPAWLVAAVLVLSAAGLAVAGLGGEDASAPAPVPAASEGGGEEPPLPSRPRAVDFTGVGTPPPPAEGREAEDSPSPGAQSDAEIRAELSDMRRFLAALDSTGPLQVGARARVLPDGTAVAPRNAPRAVKLVIKAGNAIAKTPYRWGGGHAGWTDTGYDCSGSVSYALAGGGLLDRPLASGAFMRWGEQGAGRWITIYTNPGHIFMVVAGLRFDTSGRGDRGTRWQEGARSASGYAVRHYPGL
jgi:hypothetical protein